jgi:hypothetical protein
VPKGRNNAKRACHIGMIGRMKKNLKFADPLLAQNPDDALIMSLLVTYHLENELLESFWDMGAMMFFDNIYYYDTHFGTRTESIRKRTVLYQNISKEDIVSVLMSLIDGDEYGHLMLDRSEMGKFKNILKNRYLHPVTVLGYDDEKQSFTLIDFIENRYKKFTCSFSDMERAYESTLELLVDCQLKDWKIFNVYETEKRAVNIKKMKEKIVNFLSGKVEEVYFDIMNTHKVGRMSKQGIYYEILPQRVDLGVNVLRGIEQHMNYTLLNSEKYAFELKALYLIYANAKLLKFRVETIGKNRGIEGERINELYRQTRENFENSKIMLNLGVKYMIGQREKDLMNAIKYMRQVVKQQFKILDSLLAIL